MVYVCVNVIFYIYAFIVRYKTFGICDTVLDAVHNNIYFIKRLGASK